MIKINPVDTDKSNIEQPDAVNSGILPSLPASYLVVGRSGSGKSTVLYNLLSSPQLLGGAFNYIFVFSDVETDDVLKKLNLPDENFITGDKFNEDTIKGILDKISKKIKECGLKDSCGQYRIAMVFDDVLSKQKLLRSDIMRKLVTANRHYLVSVFMLTQYLKGVPPTVRQNCSGVVFFPASLSEVEKLADENCEPMMSKKTFVKLVQHATADKHSFLFINRKSPCGQRLRKGFDIILKIR